MPHLAQIALCSCVGFRLAEFERAADKQPTNTETRLSSQRQQDRSTQTLFSFWSVPLSSCLGAWLS